MTEKKDEIAMLLGAEVIMLILAFLRQMGLTDSQIDATLTDTRAKFYEVIDTPLPEVPE